jgi:hypothetical protein
LGRCPQAIARHVPGYERDRQEAAQMSQLMRRMARLEREIR